jgi:hypothetical protein
MACNLHANKFESPCVPSSHTLPHAHTLTHPNSLITPPSKPSLPPEEMVVTHKPSPLTECIYTGGGSTVSTGSTDILVSFSSWDGTPRISCSTPPAPDVSDSPGSCTSGIFSGTLMAGCGGGDGSTCISCGLVVEEGSMWLGRRSLLCG